METDEDEDVIFEGSQLYEHLIASSYSGPDINFYNSGKNILPIKDEASAVSQEKPWITNLLSLCSKFGFNQYDHEEEFAQEIIQAVIKTPLVSLEDADFLVNMFDNRISSEISHPSRLDGNFTISTIGGVGLLVFLLNSPRMPWAFRVPSFFYVGTNILHVVNKRINDWKRKKYCHIVERFQLTLSLLQELYSTMGKSVQFVQEMELIDRGFTLPNLITHLSMKTLPNQPSALLCMPLRQELVETAQELREISQIFTLYMRESLPLNSSVDNPSHYVACSEQIAEMVDKQHVTLQTIRAAMKECHLQLSEMLRRLALSFLVPTSQRHIELLVELDQELAVRIRPLIHRLQMAHDYYTAWKVSDPSDILCTAVVSNDGDRPKGLDLALHSLERHLRATGLIIDSVRGTELVVGKRIQLSHECKAILTCWELVEMEMEKLSKPATQQEAIRSSSIVVEPSRRSHVDEMLPLYGAWQPDVEDLEILEADLRQVDLSCDDDDLLMLKRETREERLARKRESAAQSKRLYSELQVVLKSKAAEWKEREARVMERLGRPVETEEPIVVTDSQPEDNDASQPERWIGTDSAIRFDTKIVPSSMFGLQASLAAQVRALASQRTVQNEDVIGDSDDAESPTPSDS